MTPEEYKSELTKICGHRKMDVGAKYIRHWDQFWLEKNYCIDLMKERNMLQGVNSILEVGAGIGMLGYLLKQEIPGLDFEHTDTDEYLNEPIYKGACDLLNSKRYSLYINDSQPMNLPRKYDMLVATRTVFDRECMPPGVVFNYRYWLDDCFKYVDKVFVKTNYQASGKGFQDYIRPFLFFPHGLGKPRRGWYIIVTKEQWNNRVER